MYDCSNFDSPLDIISIVLHVFPIDNKFVCENIHENRHFERRLHIVCVCVFVCVCVCMCVCVCLCVCVFNFLCVYMCMRTCVHVHMCVCVYQCVFVSLSLQPIFGVVSIPVPDVETT